AACGNASVCTATAKFPGTWSAQVSFLPQSGAPAVTSAPADVQIDLKLKLRQVSFDGLVIQKDLPGSITAIGDPGDPAWKDDNPPDANNPVAYVRKSRMKIAAVIEVLSPLPKPVTGVTIEGKAKGGLAGTLCTFQATGVTLSAGPNPVPDILCDALLPDRTENDSMTIEWSSKLSG